MPFHVILELGASALPPFTVKSSVASACSEPSRSKPGLPSWLRGAGGNGRAGHVIVDRKLNVGVAGDLLERVIRTNLPLRQTNRALAAQANRVHLPGCRSNQHNAVEVVRLQRKHPAFVLQQHRRFFAGLLDDLRVRLNSPAR